LRHRADGAGVDRSPACRDRDRDRGAGAGPSEVAAEADRYAASHRKRAARIRALGRQPPKRVTGTSRIQRSLGRDRAGRVAHDDDRGLADGGGDVVAGFGELHREAEVVPGGALEDALLLALVLRWVGVEPEGTSLMPFDGQATRGPAVRPDWDMGATLLSVGECSALPP